MIAGTFRKYGLYDRTGKQGSPTLGLFETGREAVGMAYDILIPFPKKRSLGVRLQVI